MRITKREVAHNNLWLTVSQSDLQMVLRGRIDASRVHGG